MLQDISWSDYLATIATATLAYYAVVAYLFYKKDIAALLPKTQTDQQSFSHLNQWQNPSDDGNYLPKEPITKTDLDSTDGLLDSLGQIIIKASEDHTIKEELLFALQLQINRFDLLKQPQLKVTAKSYIMQQCQAYCHFQVTEKEVEGLWQS